LTLALAAIAGLILSLFYVVSPAFADHDPPDGPAVAPSVQPFPGGEPVCKEGVGVRFTGAELVDGASEGGVTLIDVDVAGGTITFSVAPPDLAAVVSVKGGNDQNVYDYSGLAGGGIAHDDGLTTPINPNNQQPYGLSHVDFCVVEGPPPPSVPASVPASVEGSVGGGTGTPAPSLPNTALSLPGSGSLATLFFGAILIASLGALAYANVTAVRRRR
jgi:hypothetical protein